MSDPLKELLAAGAVPTTSFPPTSRYSGIQITSYDPGEGAQGIPHLARRFCPEPERFALLYRVQAHGSDRRDTLAAAHSGDPEMWWRLADANGVIDPRDLTTPVGRTVRVTLAVDIPGSADG